MKQNRRTLLLKWAAAMKTSYRYWTVVDPRWIKQGGGIKQPLKIHVPKSKPFYEHVQHPFTKESDNETN